MADSENQSDQGIDQPEMAEGSAKETITTESVATDTSPQATESDFNQQLPIDQSKSFIGKWNRLISTTNWEKGNIVVRWRESLIEEGASPMQYSDEAWSRMVGDVTAQHVGRLRRTYERFSATYEKFEGLYWSHFYAALDWDDAEMWLEGAVQNRWSVSIMRRQRWETLGRIPEHEPRVADVVVSEIDEGFQPLQFDQQINKADALEVSGPRYDEPDFGDEPNSTDEEDSRTFIDVVSEDKAVTEADAQPAERIFEDLADLPEDLADAVEAMKLSILRHKMSEWDEISQQDVLNLLDALKKLTN